MNSSDTPRILSFRFSARSLGASACSRDCKAEDKLPTQESGLEPTQISEHTEETDKTRELMMNFSENSEVIRGGMSRSLCGCEVFCQSEAVHHAAVNSILWGEGRLQLPNPHLGPVLGWLSGQMV